MPGQAADVQHHENDIDDHEVYAFGAEAFQEKILCAFLPDQPDAGQNPQHQRNPENQEHPGLEGAEEAGEIKREDDPHDRKGQCVRKIAA